MERHLRQAVRVFSRHARYRREARNEIAARNLRLSEAACLLTCSLLLFFYAVTPQIIRGWHPTPQHLLFFPSMVVVYALVRLVRRMRRSSPTLSMAVTLLCESTILLFCALIDALEGQAVRGTFMPVIVIALPVLFVLPLRLSYLPILAAEALYVAMSYRLKLPSVAQYDAFGALVGLLCSLCVGVMVQNLRMQDHELQVRYQQLSMHDGLVGVLNKATGEAEMRRYLESAGERITCMLLMIDLDNFKQVNDRLGHLKGDELLRGVGAVLARVFRATDVVCRFGGDEFCVLIKYAGDGALLQERCRILREELSRASQEMIGEPLAVSIGGIWMQQQTAGLEELLRQADKALYEAKAQGKGCYVLRAYREA